MQKITPKKIKQTMNALERILITCIKQSVRCSQLTEFTFEDIEKITQEPINQAIQDAISILKSIPSLTLPKTNMTVIEMLYESGYIPVSNDDKDPKENILMGLKRL